MRKEVIHIPDVVLIPAVDQLNASGKLEVGIDDFRELEASMIREECGAAYEHIETDWIRRRCIKIRKRGNSDPRGKFKTVSKNPHGRRKRPEPPQWYKDYLKTPHWQAVRGRCLGYWSYACACCKSTKKLEVHHNTYERLWCELPTDVIALCRACHGKLHTRMEDYPDYNPTGNEAGVEAPL